MTDPLIGPNVYCIYEPRCEGVQVSYGEKRLTERGCVNQAVTCLKCARQVAELSTRKAQPEAVRA